MNTEVIIHPRLHHLGLTTGNLEAMIRWYRKALGMKSSTNPELRQADKAAGQQSAQHGKPRGGEQLRELVPTITERAGGEGNPERTGLRLGTERRWSCLVEHQRLFRDPAPPAFRPGRGFGGGGARRHSNRTKDLDNVAQKAVIKQAPPGRFKAGSRPRDAPSETGHNHCRRHAGNRWAAPFLLQYGIAQHPHFIERVAVFPFKAPGPMNEKTIQDQDEVVEEKRFKRSGGRAGIPSLLPRCPGQNPVSGELRFDLRATGVHIVFRISDFVEFCEKRFTARLRHFVKSSRWTGHGGASRMLVSLKPKRSPPHITRILPSGRGTKRRRRRLNAVPSHGTCGCI
jgi:catechol 2,3-dioxygenase-like lactoylglutathione lyase family enzyme